MKKDNIKLGKKQKIILLFMDMKVNPISTIYMKQKIGFKTPIYKSLEILLENNLIEKVSQSENDKRINQYQITKKGQSKAMDIDVELRKKGIEYPYNYLTKELNKDENNHRKAGSKMKKKVYKEFPLGLFNIKITDIDLLDNGFVEYFGQILTPRNNYIDAFKIVARNETELKEILNVKIKKIIQKEKEPKKAGSKAKTKSSLSEKDILKALGNDQLTFKQLSKKLNANENELKSLLMYLKERAIIREYIGMYYLNPNLKEKRR